MGLDVSVYTHVKKVSKDIEDYDFVAFVIDKAWNDRIKNLEDGAHYVGKCADAGVSYSYGSHTIFRNLLCTMLGYKEDEWLNENSGWNTEIPFFELFHFADNEGCIDWETSAKLYNDFVKYNADFKRLYSDMPNWYNRYNDWQEVFKTAKENGVVNFR